MARITTMGNGYLVNGSGMIVGPVSATTAERVAQMMDRGVCATAILEVARE